MDTSFHCIIKGLVRKMAWTLITFLQFCNASHRNSYNRIPIVH